VNIRARRLRPVRTLVLSSGAAITLFLALSAMTGSVAYQDEDPVAWWKFDQKDEHTVEDSVTEIDDEISGNYRYVRGVDGPIRNREFHGIGQEVEKSLKNQISLVNLSQKSD